MPVAVTVLYSLFVVFIAPGIACPFKYQVYLKLAIGVFSLLGSAFNVGLSLSQNEKLSFRFMVGVVAHSPITNRCAQLHT